MKKNSKLKLKTLKVKSFVTTVENSSSETVKGGTIYVTIAPTCNTGGFSTPNCSQRCDTRTTGDTIIPVLPSQLVNGGCNGTTPIVTRTCPTIANIC